MGLDMYAFSVPVELAGEGQVNFKFKDIKVNELAYWRKFNHLHGWMEKLYRTKGGTAPDFNCAPVRLMPDDLDLLEYALKNNNLEHTPGFFFGGSEMYPEDVEKTQKFIDDARQAIKDGQAVLYDSWW